MHEGTKIATCCYCGTRAALVFNGKARHELACSGCGAPLHELKALKPRDGRHGPRNLVHPTVARQRPVTAAKPSRERRKRKKPRKSRLRWLVEEAFDVVEDIFD